MEDSSHVELFKIPLIHIDRQLDLMEKWFILKISLRRSFSLSSTKGCPRNILENFIERLKIENTVYVGLARAVRCAQSAKPLADRKIPRDG